MLRNLFEKSRSSVYTAESRVLRNAVVCKHHRKQHWTHFTTFPGLTQSPHLYTMACLQVIDVNVNTSVSLFHWCGFFHLCGLSLTPQTLPQASRLASVYGSLYFALFCPDCATCSILFIPRCLSPDTCIIMFSKFSPFHIGRCCKSMRSF